MNDDDKLSHFVESVCGDSHLRIEDDFGDGFVRLRSAEAERRQAAHDIRSSEDAVIELLRNARDAHARNIFLSSTKEGTERHLVILDDGIGVPEHMHARIFEPRVTSKLNSMHMDKWGVHGRGMALYSINVNSLRSFVVSSGVGLGTSLVVQTDTRALTERADQSSYPTFDQTPTGALSMRGPRNIIRTCCEFALESRASCNVYLGSVTEIAATLFEYGVATLSPASRAFNESISDVPICKRLALAGDPEGFSTIAQSLGLNLSSRSARRILDGEISPLISLEERLRLESEKCLSSHQRASNASKNKSVSRSQGQSVKLSANDKAAFAQGIKNAYASIADAYYLENDIEPSIAVSSDTIRITIPVIKRP